MSLLGFDAPGRLALGQLSAIGLTNRVLTAGTGLYAIAGQSVAFKMVQLTGGGARTVTGNAAILTTVLASSTGAYSAAGNAVTFPIRFSVGAAGYSEPEGAPIRRTRP